LTEGETFELSISATAEVSKKDPPGIRVGMGYETTLTIVEQQAAFVGWTSQGVFVPSGTGKCKFKVHEGARDKFHIRFLPSGIGTAGCVFVYEKDKTPSPPTTPAQPQETPPATLTAVDDGPSAPTTQSDDDGYWEWLDEFNDMRDRHQNRVNAIRLVLKSSAKKRRELRAKFFGLMYIDMKSFPSAEDDDILNRTRFRSTFTQAALEELRQAREQLRVEMLAIRPQQESLIQQALRLMNELTDSAEVQQIASKERRPQLKDTIEACQDRYALTKLDLYDTAELYDELPQVVEEFQFASNAVREVALLMSAKVALARADKLDEQLWVLVISPKPFAPNSQVERAARAARIQAVNTLYEVLKLNPSNVEARRMLREQELKFIGWIAAKLDREKRFSLAGFHRYLQVRGYSTEPHKDGWDVFIECFRTYLGSGPTTLTAGLPGLTADVMADIATMDQENVAKNQVSLFGIRRLMHSGMTLREIRNINTDEMLKRLAFQTIDRKPVGVGRARRLAQDIHETLAELYDLRALTEGNQEAFEEFFARNYYQAINPERTWGEAIGDFFFSPIGILGWFGPSAIVRVDGRWAVLSPGSTRLLEEAGRIQRARDLFATTLRLEEAGTLMGQYMPGFRSLQQAIIADQAFLANLSGFERFLNSGSRLAAVIVIYGAADHLAEEARSPILKVLVEALGILGAEEMTYGILERSGIRTKLLTHLDELKGVIGRQRAELTEARQAVQRLENLSQKLTGSAPNASRMNDIDINQIDDIISKSPSASSLQSAPGSHRSDDLHSAVTAAGEALKAGDVGEAKRSLKFAKDNLNNMVKTLDALDLKWQQARALLSKQPSLRQVDLTQTSFLTGRHKPESFIPPPGGYPSGEHGKFMEMGDEALRRGELEKAEDLYRAALGEAKNNGVQDPKKLIDYRLSLVAHARESRDGFRRLRSVSPPAPVDAPIPTTEVDEIVRRIEAKDLKLEGPLGSLNDVFLLKDSRGKVHYVFKSLNGDKEVEIGLERFCAAVTNQLQDALGFKAAACQRVRLPADAALPPAARGAQGLLSRYITGQPLIELNEAVLVALKDDYAKQRVLRLWFGDTDGQLGNLRLGNDGRLAPIDFGFAHLNSNFEHHRQFHPETILRRKPQSQADLMRACLAFPERVPQLYAGHSSVPLYAWLDRIDGMLNYDDMKGAVDAIKGLCNERGGQRLKEILQETLPADQVDEAFQALMERATGLETVLKEKYPSFQKTSLLPFPKSPRLAMRLQPRQGLPAALPLAA
jgi:hypothetical protein